MKRWSRMHTVGALLLVGVLGNVIFWSLAWEPNPAALAQQINEDAARSVVETDPSRYFGMLSQRCTTPDGHVAWQNLGEVDRHLYATLLFEMEPGACLEPTAGGDVPPTLGEIRDGYLVMGLAKPAEVVQKMQLLQKTHVPLADRRWGALLTEITALKNEMAGRRKAYITEHVASPDSASR